MTPTGHDELKEQQGWVTRALNAEARVEELEREHNRLTEALAAVLDPLWANEWPERDNMKIANAVYAEVIERV